MLTARYFEEDWKCVCEWIVGLSQLCSLVCISEHSSTHNKAMHCYANVGKHNWPRPSGLLSVEGRVMS